MINEGCPCAACALREENDRQRHKEFEAAIKKLGKQPEIIKLKEEFLKKQDGKQIKELK